MQSAYWATWKTSWARVDERTIHINDTGEGARHQLYVWHHAAAPRHALRLVLQLAATPAARLPAWLPPTALRAALQPSCPQVTSSACLPA